MCRYRYLIALPALLLSGFVSCRDQPLEPEMSCRNILLNGGFEAPVNTTHLLRTLGKPTTAADWYGGHNASWNLPDIILAGEGEAPSASGKVRPYEGKRMASLLQTACYDQSILGIVESQIEAGTMRTCRVRFRVATDRGKPIQEAFGAYFVDSEDFSALSVMDASYGSEVSVSDSWITIEGSVETDRPWDWVVIAAYSREPLSMEGIHIFIDDVRVEECVSE